MSDCRIIVVGFENPLEKRIMLGDVNSIEELDPKCKYTFQYLDGHWVRNTEVVDDDEDLWGDA